MGKTNVAVIIVALLIGAVLGYLPMQFENIKLQDEIQALRNQINSLNASYLEVLQKHIELFNAPQNVTKLADRMRVVIVESETRNRTVYLDPNQWYCKVIVFHGGNNPFQWDLAYPNASIVYFFLEDIEDPGKADNYSDLIVRMNPIIDKDGKLKMVVVFFAEGGYGKLIYYSDLLLHQYKDDDPTSNYGIALLDINDSN